MLESPRSFLKASGSGDACVVDDSPRPSHELLADIHDALKLILGDAYNPFVDDPVEALAVCGPELLKNDDIPFDLCHRLLRVSPTVSGYLIFTFFIFQLRISHRF